jgi:hypothetical protein
MKTTIKLLSALAFIAVLIFSCTTKPSETPDSDGKDSIVSDTSRVEPDTVKGDTVGQ